MTGDEKIRRCFDNIYDHYQYFASFLMEWNRVWSKPQPHYAATDGPNLYLNPDFIDELNIAESLKVIKHEAGHVFLGHMYLVPLSTLENEQERYEWNIAMDLSLNSLWGLHDPDYAMTTGDKVAELLIFPGKVHKTFGNDFVNMPPGKSAEFYHNLVKGKYPQPKPSGQGQGNGKGEGNSPSPQSGGGSQGSTGQDSSTGSGGNGTPSGADGASAKGAATSGNTVLPEGRSASFGDVLPHPVMGSGDKEAISEAKLQHEFKVAQGINNARQHGNLPGWLEEMATSTLYGKSVQNWKGLLRKFMTKVVNHGGQSYDKPHRRLSYLSEMTGFIIPANQSRQASKGCILVDTSGSMSTNQCNQALSEIEGILSYFPRCEVDMVMADTRLIEKSKRTFHHSDFPLRLDPTWLGRGGTNLCQPILGVADDRSYKWLVVISDMEWQASEAENPKIPTIFIWTPRVEQAEPYQTAPFGTLIGPVVAQ